MYDILIIGAGPAGLTAALYAARGGMNTLVIESNVSASQITKTHEIENYPAFVSISGKELNEKMREHALAFGVKTIRDDVLSYDLQNKSVTTYSNGEIKAKKLILAMGASPMEHPNAKSFSGRGISYCATCDGNFCRNREVMVIGGGDTALTEALYLAGIAKKVYVLHRRDKFRAREALIKAVAEKENVEIIYNGELVSVLGEEKLTGVKITVLGEERELPLFKLFVAIGTKANSDKVMELKNERGYIVTDEHMQTSVDGVFAVGDIRVSPLRQVVTACADGAVAAEKAIGDILDNK